MPENKERVVRDPIHGYIELSPQEASVIDCRSFQRLRGIKQLATAHLVFPGATHTRFEHSLGAMHVAGLMAARVPKIAKNKTLTVNIRLAGLLHDLGHGPFSHVSEEIVARVINKPKFKNLRIALDAFQADDEIKKALGGKRKQVTDLLDREGKHGVAHDILDGPIDGDKLDYLLRDSYYCGVPYGNPDILRVLYSLQRLVRGNPIEEYLGISRKGLDAVQALHFARYNMHRIVYNHKVRRITDAMIVRAAVLAIEDGNSELRSCFAYRPGSRAFLKRYFSLDDYEFIRLVIDSGGTGGRMMKMLKDRRLLKVAYSVDIADLKGLSLANAQALDAASSTALEKRITHESGANPDYVVVDKQSIESPVYRDPGGSLNSINKILVANKPQPSLIHEMPGIWSPIPKNAVDKVWVYSLKNDVQRVAPVAKRLISNL